jgi:hypothetical protein
MRLAAQIKQGFYPIPPEVTSLIAAKLAPADPSAGERTTVLDPCAGEGVALYRLAAGLGVPAGGRYAIELDEVRGEKCRSNLGAGSHVLAPASFFGTRTSGGFGLIYLNPPFDDELGGGGREETRFLMNATWNLAYKGVLAMVLPERALTNRDIGRHLDSWYAKTEGYAFPAEHRRFKECVVFGYRRRDPLPEEARRAKWEVWSPYRDPLPSLSAAEPGRFVVPTGGTPRWFEKMGYTEAEMVRAIEESPVNRFLERAPKLPMPSPPLSLSKGHVALLLAGGKLDGMVRPEGERPHVVRGTARKEKYLADVSESENENGSRTVRETYAERIILTVRAVASDGVIHTWES